jgi:limonene-1,2-epoxide hydrolase
MSSAQATVASFIKAWEARNVDQIMTHFTADAVYHNIPMKPAQGTEAIGKLIGKLVSPASEIRFQVLREVADGAIVMNERIDTFVIDGKTVSLPVMGVFEVQDGKIKAWRDYFKQLG